MGTSFKELSVKGIRQAMLCVVSDYRYFYYYSNFSYL